jgi:hypothetical protein
VRLPIFPARFASSWEVPTGHFSYRHADKPEPRCRPRCEDLQCVEEKAIALNEVVLLRTRKARMKVLVAMVTGNMMGLHHGIPMACRRTRSLAHDRVFRGFWNLYGAHDGRNSSVFTARWFTRPLQPHSTIHWLLSQYVLTLEDTFGQLAGQSVFIMMIYMPGLSRRSCTKECVLVLTPERKVSFSQDNRSYCNSSTSPALGTTGAICGLVCVFARGSLWGFPKYGPMLRVGCTDHTLAIHQVCCRIPSLRKLSGLCSEIG